MKKIFSILFGLCCLLCAHQVKAQGIAIRTNLAEWAVQAPNLGVDFVLGENSTINIAAAATIGESYIHAASVQKIQFEYRYWFSAQPYENFFLGLQLQPLHYRVKVNHSGEKDLVHDGVAFPLGFNFGYSWPLSPKFNLELCYGAGWMFYNNNCSLPRYKDDGMGNMVEAPELQDSHNKTFTTTNFGINLTYILK